jgi:hypothetical protein
MLELTVGDRVRSREGITGTVMRREHDFEHPRYVIDWDDGRAKRDLAERGSRVGRTVRCDGLDFTQRTLRLSKPVIARNSTGKEAVYADLEVSVSSSSAARAQGTGRSSIRSRSEDRNRYYGPWHGVPAHWARPGRRTCRCSTEARWLSASRTD